VLLNLDRIDQYDRFNQTPDLPLVLSVIQSFKHITDDDIRNFDLSWKNKKLNFLNSIASTHTLYIYAHPLREQLTVFKDSRTLPGA
jgi:hypothetical protein